MQNTTSGNRYYTGGIDYEAVGGVQSYQSKIREIFLKRIDVGDDGNRYASYSLSEDQFQAIFKVIDDEFKVLRERLVDCAIHPTRNKPEDDDEYGTYGLEGIDAAK